MAQRASGHSWRPNEDYATPPAVTATSIDYLQTLGQIHAWDSACGDKDALGQELRAAGFTVTSTSDDFLAYRTPPAGVDLVITNPPYGAQKRGELGEAFIRHALSMPPIRHVIMLLAIDFDSAIGRPDLFRANPMFAGKIVLIGRIKWFVGPKSPSTNHAWFLWDRAHAGPPVIRYAEVAPHNRNPRQPSLFDRRTSIEVAAP